MSIKINSTSLAKVILVSVLAIAAGGYILVMLHLTRPATFYGTPEVGEFWCRTIVEDNPWAPPKVSCVEVLAVKDGWIKYRLNGNLDFPTELKTFLHIYTFQENPELLETSNEH